MRIEVLDEAEQDLVDGARFYESQEAGLGQHFLDELFSDIDSLRACAGVHALHFDCHRLLSHRFPRAVYDRVEGKVVQIWAVLDCRRDPESVPRRFPSDRP